MLILTRKLDESIVVGDKIIIKLLEVAGQTVRLGITAPKNVIVYRKELYERIARGELSSSEPLVEPVTAVVVTVESGSVEKVG